MVYIKVRPAGMHSGLKHGREPGVEKFHQPQWLAERYGTSVDVLANWRSQGKGPAYVKLGRKVMYRESDVLAWERAQTVQAAVA